MFRHKFLQNLKRYLGFEQPTCPALPIFPGDPPVKLQGQTSDGFLHAYIRISQSSGGQTANPVTGFDYDYAFAHFLGLDSRHNACSRTPVNDDIRLFILSHVTPPP
ncbi:hypothetical protein D3C71_1733170 [compost metagenome]